MTNRDIEITIGSFLHDIGKILYRSGQNGNHSQSGYDFLKNEAHISDEAILNCVRFHHGNHLKGAVLSEDSSAYVTYFADNVAAAADRRESFEKEDGFDRKVPLSSIFNILNGNQENYHFARQVLDPDKGVNYPQEKPVEMDEFFYRTIVSQILDNLKGITFTEEYVNSLLSILEATLSYIPSSTSKRELADISLYDHVKMTAAIAICVEQYLKFKKEKNYREKLFIHANETYAEKMFLLYSMDVSGIQNFIYTIASQKALKGLRARSFYLELVMEHIIDELLTKLSLSRANLIYCGGGHCYLLLPNTEDVRKAVEEQENIVNNWFLDMFGTSLYVAGGYVSCSANDLKNVPEGSYSALYIEISKKISIKKSHRYQAQDIMKLNGEISDGERECKVCRRIEKLNADDKCPMCAALEKMSGNILYQKFFTVISNKEADALPLPGEKYLVADTKEGLLLRMESDTYVRCYTKNRIYTGKHVTTKLWVGAYTTGDSFEELAQKAEGINRIAILRADVDNLGKAFVFGFQRPGKDNRYVTLSRTATLSRQLSLFFKCYINQIMENGKSDCLGGGGKRNITIVYSGGDDVFLAGAWNEVIEAFIDLREALGKFTQNTLTISGGIGLYHSGYPINIMAKEVERLENQSKDFDGKDAITLFDENGSYKWNVFLERVLGEKFKLIKSFFEISDDRGKAFLYHLLELIRNSGEQINFARYVYLLSRMEPDKECSEEQQKAYQTFSRKMYEWMKIPQDRKELLTAMYLYVYLTRDEEDV
ncbi:MAG: type III-A CRISPR-associated protein Cas10/Csm1 [Lachnospiraceae bacterium]|nr:type III-A CRISPR-associated protein Cas10/Csm1 [Lachnospiraceae bacterium]